MDFKQRLCCLCTAIHESWFFCVFRSHLNQGDPVSIALWCLIPPKRWCATVTTPCQRTIQTTCTTRSCCSTSGITLSIFTSSNTYISRSFLLHHFYRQHKNNFFQLPYLYVFVNVGVDMQTTVTSVQQSPDFSLSGQWEVATVSKMGDEERYIFDAVMVCSGHYTHPVLPLNDFQGNSMDAVSLFYRLSKDSWIKSLSLSCCTIPAGHKTFSGQLVHSWEYKDADAYRGKRVVVVGIGSSGGDVAAEISRTAEKVKTGQ